MPKITNKKKINHAMFVDIQRTMNSHISREEGGYYLSATEIICPPQQVWLKIRHDDEIEVDASDCIDLWIGTCCHDHIHESAKATGYPGDSEKRFKVEICGKIISGGMDDILDEEISDYKITKAYSAGMVSTQAKWESQLNIYKYMAEENGYDIKKLSIWPVLKDFKPWEKGKPIIKKGVQLGKFLEKQCARLPIPIWDRNFTKTWLERRVQRFMAAEEVSDLMLSKVFPCGRCTDKFADEGLWEGRRCVDYCMASGFCHQYAKRLGKKVKG